MNNVYGLTINQKAYIFEEQVYKYLLSLNIGLVKILRYPDNRGSARNSGDGGRDFEVEISSEYEDQKMFGEAVIAGKTYYVEAKYSDNKVSYNSAAANLSRIQNHSLAAVFVVTNSYFNPSSYFDLTRNFSAQIAEVFIIDGVSFLSQCKNNKLEWPSQLTINEPKETVTDGLRVISHQTGCRLSGEHAYLFYLSFYNLTEEGISLDLFSQTDESWSFTNNNFLRNNDKIPDSFESDYNKSIYIPAKCSRSLSLCGRPLRAISKNKESLSEKKSGKEHAARLAVKYGETITPVLSNFAPFEICFRLPFTGKKNNEILEVLKPAFNKLSRGREKSEPETKLLKIFHLYGQAGVGKSRLIDEILPARENSQVAVFHHTINSERKSISKRIVGRIAGKHAKDLVVDFEFEKDILEYLLGKYQEKINFESWGLIIIVLEDLHHADETLCDKIMQIIDQITHVNVPTALVLSSRNDDTFINSNYRELEGKLRECSEDNGRNKQLPFIYSQEVYALEDFEAKQLISEAIKGITEAGVTRLHRLSANIPQHIVQCIEYLLDETLLDIDKRNSLSIVDLYSFEKKAETLPENMELLFAKRFLNLESWVFGSFAMDAILAATSFGTNFPMDVCALSNERNEIILESVCNELINRRFFKRNQDGSDDILEWSHENLLVFFQGLRRSFLQNNIGRKRKKESKSPLQNISFQFESNAHKLYQDSAIYQLLPEFVRGDIAIINRDYRVAQPIFSPLLETVSKLSSFINIEIKVQVFHHIESVIFMLFEQRHENRHELLWKLLCLKTYIGAFYLGLRFSDMSLKYARIAQVRYKLESRYRTDCELWLKSLDAHVHMDSGFIGKALKRFLELQGHVKLDNRQDPEFEFELNNCLRLIYTYTNFASFAQIHSDLCQQAVDASNCDELRYINLGDRAFMTLLTDRKKCLATLKEAVDLNEKKENIRHCWNTEIGYIANSIPDHTNDTLWLRKHSLRLHEVIKKCRKNSYHSVLPRAYLVIAVLEYLIGKMSSDKTEVHFENAVKIAKQGINATEAYSIGFVSWQIYNLLAVIEGRRQRWAKALEYMVSAVDRLEKEGLTFIGNEVVVSAVPIVYANHIKVLREIGRESEIASFLNKMHGFERYQWGKIKEHILPHIDKYHHIILTYPQKPDGLIVDDKTRLAVAVWC